MTQTAGVWKLTSSENFDELMKALGVGLITRKIGNAQKPTVTIKATGDDWEITTESTLKTNKMNFKLGVEQDQETLDGRKVRSTFALDGDKLIQTDRDAKEDKVVCVITREINSKGELLTTAVAGDIVATRLYVKQ